MALRVDELARSVLAEYRSSAGLLLAVTWIEERYKELVSKARFKHLRKVGSISIPKQYNTGTATFTEGSNVVNFAGGAGMLPSFVDRSIRVSIEWYRITDVISSTQILIDPPFGESASAPTFTGAGYVIVSRYFDLPPDRRWLGTFVHMRLRQSFTLKSLDELDAIDPERYSVDGNGPRTGAEVGLSPQTGGKRIELYPYCVNDEVISYVFWELPNKLLPSDILPSVIDTIILKEGALINHARYKMAEALNEGKADVGGTWSNIASKNETKWYARYIPQAIGASNGDDDVTFVWQSARFLNTQPNHGSRDIVTASDYVWSKPI
jgi:hypothetical protein